jgi:hypothetical protein
LWANETENEIYPELNDLMTVIPTKLEELEGIIK